MADDQREGDHVIDLNEKPRDTEGKPKVGETTSGIIDLNEKPDYEDADIIGLNKTPDPDDDDISEIIDLTKKSDHEDNISGISDLNKTPSGIKRKAKVEEFGSGVIDLNEKSCYDLKGKAKVEEFQSDEDDDNVILLYDSPTKKRRITERIMNQNIDRLRNVAMLNDTSNPLRPGSRVMSVDNLVITKLLNEYDVLPEDAKLLLDPFEACILADEPNFAEEPSPLNYRKFILAFDEFDREFNLLLSVYRYPQDYHNYKLTGGWGKFVNLHKLRGEDEIMFYKYKDEKVSSDYYYALRYFRCPKLRRIRSTATSSTGDDADDDRQKDLKDHGNVLLLE